MQSHKAMEVTENPSTYIDSTSLEVANDKIARLNENLATFLTKLETIRDKCSLMDTKHQQDGFSIIEGLNEIVIIYKDIKSEAENFNRDYILQKSDQNIDQTNIISTLIESNETKLSEINSLKLKVVELLNTEKILTEQYENLKIISERCKCKKTNMSSNDGRNNKTKEYTKINYGRHMGEPGGLENMNGRCYMNSMMHALSASEKLIEQLVQSISSNENNKNYSKLRMLIEILKELRKPTTQQQNVHLNTVTLTAFLDTVQWNRTSQQDAVQALSFFINAIHKELGTDRRMPPKFKLLHTFTENSQYNKKQDHLVLAVPLCGSFSERPGVTINDLLRAFFEPSSIDNGQHKTTMYLFDNAPVVMIVHIQANEWFNDLNTYIKPRYYINYGQKLEHTFNIQKDINESKWEIVTVKYNLVAVVEHMGDVHGGHYVTYRRCEDRWYLTNDTQVQEVTFTCDIVPYIMVYEKEEEYIIIESSSVEKS